MTEETVIREDPIEEIYAIRERISERYGHDIHRLFAAARERRIQDEANGIKYIRLPIARVAPAKA